MKDSEPVEPAQVTPDLGPHAAVVSTGQVIVGGSVAWLVALVVTLVVPSLHQGPREWWPWTCVGGLALGLFGYSYVRRGRGNARDAG